MEFPFFSVLCSVPVLAWLIGAGSEIKNALESLYEDVHKLLFSSNVCYVVFLSSCPLQTVFCYPYRHDALMKIGNTDIISRCDIRPKLRRI